MVQTGKRPLIGNSASRHTAQSVKTSRTVAKNSDPQRRIHIGKLTYPCGIVNTLEAAGHAACNRRGTARAAPASIRVPRHGPVDLGAGPDFSHKPGPRT